MYYKIDLANCKRYADGSYLVILASTGESMVSLTNLKVKGYTLTPVAGSDLTWAEDTLDLQVRVTR